MPRRLAVLVLAASVLAGAPAQAQGPAGFGGLFGHPAPPPPPTFVYRGWRIDISNPGRGVHPDMAAKRIEAQLDIVERAAPAPQVLAFMQGVPIIADPAEATEPGVYMRGHGVLLRVKRLDPKKPQALRQLLYAFQDQRLPGGYANPVVARARQEAMARRVWPQTAAMLHSDPDFFAFTASAYLAGAITREPYNRANLRATQPGYYRWLAGVFDGGRPRG
jgi:hypothetical protein